MIDEKIREKRVYLPLEVDWNMYSNKTRWGLYSTHSLPPALL
jgi:hypothetical protein